VIWPLLRFQRTFRMQEINSEASNVYDIHVNDDEVIKRAITILDKHMFHGTIDGASVYPREVVREAISQNAAAIIFAHYVPRNIMRIMCPVSLCGVFH